MLDAITVRSKEFSLDYFMALERHIFVREHKGVRQIRFLASSKYGIKSILRQPNFQQRSHLKETAENGSDLEIMDAINYTKNFRIII